MNIRRTAFWLLLIVFICLFVASLFYFPYNRQRLCRAIPSNAAFVSEHERLAARWQALASNPVGQAILRGMGVKEKALAAIASDPQIDGLMRRLAPRDTLLAYVPEFGLTGQPAWVLSSWVGGAGQVRKLELTLGLIPGFRPVRLGGGRKAWLLDAKSGTSGADRFSVTVVEGVLLGCLSPDPSAVRFLMERIDRSEPLLPELAAALSAQRPGADTPDRGWICWQAPGSGLKRRRVWMWKLTDITPTRLSGSVTGDVGLNVAGGRQAAWGASNEVEAVGRLLVDPPALALVAPCTDLRRWLMSLMSPGVAEAVQALLNTNVVADAPAFVCVGDARSAGRLFGLKVPTLMVGVQIADADGAVSTVSAGLDRLNARYGYGLIASRLAGGDASAFIVVDGTTPSLYKRLGREERPAFAVRGDWLVFASNLDGLRKVVARSEELPESAARAAWLSARGAGRSAWLWVDIRSTADALNKALAVYSLLTLAQSSREGVALNPKGWEVARDWVETLKPFETLTARWDASGPAPEICFVLGGPTLEE